MPESQASVPEKITAAQEAREMRANGGRRRKRPINQLGMYAPVNASDRPKMQNKLTSTGSVAMSNWICRDLVARL